jgi:hypothetical protein
MIHKNGECVGCLEDGLLIDVSYVVCGSDRIIDIPMCIKCRMNINVHDEKEYQTPLYYWAHMQTVVQQRLPGFGFKPSPKSLRDFG